MALFTLKFPNYPTAVAVATALGFWDLETDALKTDGQSVDPVTGETFGWNITYCGPETITPAVNDGDGNVITPAVLSSEVFAIVVGQLRPEAEVFLDPRGYGYSGHLYAGTSPQPHPTP
jgi:hypothetical protein